MIAEQVKELWPEGTESGVEAVAMAVNGVIPNFASASHFGPQWVRAVILSEIHAYYRRRSCTLCGTLGVLNSRQQHYICSQLHDAGLPTPPAGDVPPCPCGVCRG